MQTPALKFLTKTFVWILIWPISSRLRRGNNSYFPLYQIDCVIRILARFIPAIVWQTHAGFRNQCVHKTTLKNSRTKYNTAKTGRMTWSIILSLAFQITIEFKISLGAFFNIECTSRLVKHGVANKKFLFEWHRLLCSLFDRNFWTYNGIRFNLLKNLNLELYGTCWASTKFFWIEQNTF